ncbi:MAG: cyclic nucleotide-binding domain-containing protein [Lentisphaeria bacterium]|nr:cyclic nucleotide-binding domain-containing protein [Lentisphaeria bacterium]
MSAQSNNTFFDFFSDEARVVLEHAAEKLVCEQGQVIFVEGADSDAVFLVESGMVHLLKESGETDPCLIASVEAGKFFGEFGVIDTKPRSTGARSATGASLLRIDRTTVLRALRMCGDAPLRMAASIVEKTRVSNSKYVGDLLQRERLTLVGRMLSGILHDFRNPLTVVRMCAEIIVMRGVEPETVEDCQIIVEQLDRITRMTDDVLAFTENQTTINPMPMDVAKLLARFERLNRTYIEKQNVNLTIVGEPCTIQADEDKLLRVLQNLVYNAVDAVSAGSTITIRQENREDTVVLHVTDDGPGLPEEIQDHLFEAFATHGKRNGLGLGLAVAKSIVSIHEGTITFTTKQGEGTTFHVELPRQMQA